MLFSGAASFDRTLSSAAWRLAESGVIVVRVDLPTPDEARSSPAAPTWSATSRDLAHRLEREQGLVRYRLPVLAGVGEGATLAYAALAQAPADGRGRGRRRPGRDARDEGADLSRAPATPAAGGGFTYGASAELPGWWRVSGAGGRVTDAGQSRRGRDRGAGSCVRRRPSRRAGLRRRRRGRDAGQTGLSVVEYPSESGSDVLAIIYSGDGGWRDLDKQIGEYLAARGCRWSVSTACARSGRTARRRSWRPTSPT